MSQKVAWFAVVSALAAAVALGAERKTLDIYFIDVDGGQSTLLVTPSGESLLIDAGYPGSESDGPVGPRSKPGDPRVARDAQRIAAAARDAGITRIDLLLITHFHRDHMGGVVELAQLIPIRTFVDHGSLAPEEAASDEGLRDAFTGYAAVRAKGRHLEPKPGDRLRLKGLEVIVVSSAASTIVRPLAGAGGFNPVCAPAAPETDRVENALSTGIRVQFGRFTFLDVGDLGGRPLFALACPNNFIGPVDAYLVPHHGSADVTGPATFAAFKPRVAIINNGPRKGGAGETFEQLRHAQGLEDVWQLHRSERAGAENSVDEQIANLDERTAHWIKLSANDDGSFRVMNGRTGIWKSYAVR